MEALSSCVKALQADIGAMKASENAWWVISSGLFVFFMQCGFGMLVRAPPRP